MRRLLTICALVLACAGTVRAAEPWRDATFAKRIKVILQHANIDGDESDFPALLKVTGADEAHGQIASADITEDKWVVYDGDGNKLPWEKESYTDDGGGGFALIELWVKTDIYTAPAGDQNAAWLYYDNAATSANTTTDVWNANFQMTWHMADRNTFTVDDSTSNSRDGGKGSDNEPVVTAGGVVGDAQVFDGSNDYITTTLWAPPAGAITIELWVYNGVAGDGYCGFNEVVPPTPTTLDRCIGINASGYANAYVFNAGQRNAADDADITGAAWHHLALRIHAVNGLSILVDGVDEAQDAGGTDGYNGYASAQFVAGFGVYSAGFADYGAGTMDEVRISDVSRTDAWLKFTYRNASEADHEQTWSAAESQPAPGVGVAPQWMHFYKTRNR